MVKISPSNAGGVDSIPGPEITVPYAVECSQLQKVTYCMTPSMNHFQNNKIIETKQMSDF